MIIALIAAIVFIIIAILLSFYNDQPSVKYGGRKKNKVSRRKINK